MFSRLINSRQAEPNISESNGVRYLHLGTPWVQGAMRINDPLHLELDYIQRMMAWLLWRAEEPAAKQHALHLGLGAGALARFTSQVLGMQTTVIELSPAVVHVCQLQFFLDVKHPLLKVECADALDVIKEAQRAQTVHALLVDLYDASASRPIVHTLEQYQACQRLLHPHGLAAFNLFGRNAQFAVQHQLLAQVFGEENLATFRPLPAGNVVVVAGLPIGQTSARLLGQRAKQLEEAWALPALHWLQALQRD